MKRPEWMVVGTALAVISAGWVLHAAESTPSRAKMGRMLREGNGEGLFKYLDKNGDGKLTREELPKADSFDQLDLNHDGFVMMEEAREAIRNLAGFVGAKPSAGTQIKAEEAVRQGPRTLKASDEGVGSLIPDLAFQDIKGKSGKLSDYKKDQALVIALTSTSCPISKKYAPSLARLEKEFGAKGVKFLFINPTPTDDTKEIKAHGFAGRYVHDTENALVKALHARSTAEVLVLDAARTLVYRGAVDDQYGLGYARDTARDTYLIDALNATLKREPVAVAATTAPGCALDSGDHIALASEITYHNRISRIMQNNCVECHRKGSVGPFSLETYEDVKSHAGMIRKQVDRGVMPPWFAAPPKPGDAVHWANDRSLAPQEKADLLTWLASDRPVGNVADAALPLRFPSEWSIGKPDAIFQLPRAVDIKAEGTMPYQFLTVETSYPEDRWVSAYEIMPSVREVVHHVIVKVHPKGSNIRDAGEGTEGYWAAYVPGNSSRILPPGFAKKLPAGSTISFQIHYTPAGKAVKEQMRIGLKFATQPPEYLVSVVALPKPGINIPPGKSDHVEVAEQRVPFDLTLTAFMAHMHVRGKAFKYEVTYPDGKHETLLDIPRYDFNWQLRYECAEPKFIPAGSTMKVTAVYDNSPGNPANPDPTRTVRWGQQTSDEMMIGYLEHYTRVDAPKVPQRLRAGAQ